MKQLVVLSGKGGTGKTTITGSLAYLAGEEAIMVDCDVDAANLHLLVNYKLENREDFMGGKAIKIDNSRCNSCGLCSQLCRFDVLSVEMFPLKNNQLIPCEGCGVCARFCPKGAMTVQDIKNGQIYTSRSGQRWLVYAELDPGADASGKLVTEVRQRALAIEEKESKPYIIIDGPPGIGCPVIASLTGTDMALLVTEPTISGLHDLERILGLTESFSVKTAVCINRYDINAEISETIEKYCKQSGVEWVKRIPFDETVIKNLKMGQPVIKDETSVAGQIIREMWSQIAKSLVS